MEEEDEEEEPAAGKKWEKVRRAFGRVRLMVRVMNVWPRGHQQLMKRLSANSVASRASSAAYESRNT